MSATSDMAKTPFSNINPIIIKISFIYIINIFNGKNNRLSTSDTN